MVSNECVKLKVELLVIFLLSKDPNRVIFQVVFHLCKQNNNYKMNLRERSIIFVTFLIACWALALTAGGLGTKYWVVSSAVRLDSNSREFNISSGYIHFGLFEGTWRLDSGYGERVEHKKILEITYLDSTFLVKGLYNATIGCVTASLFFGIISALLAIVNTASNPSEPICHLPGKTQR